MASLLKELSKTPKRALDNFFSPLRKPWIYIATAVLSVPLIYCNIKCNNEAEQINRMFAQVSKQEVNPRDYNAKKVYERLDFFRSQNINPSTSYLDFFRTKRN